MTDYKEIGLGLVEVVEKLRKIQDLIDGIDNNKTTDYSILPPIPFKDGEYEPPKADVDRWVHEYGAKFVYENFQQIRNWCLDNPHKQKYSKQIVLIMLKVMQHQYNDKRAKKNTNRLR